MRSFVFLLALFAQGWCAWRKAAQGIQKGLFGSAGGLSDPQAIQSAPGQAGVYYQHSGRDSTSLPSIEPCQAVKCHMTLVVALDSSGSVGRENFIKELDFLRTLLEIIQIKSLTNDVKVCVGLVSYSTSVWVIDNPCCENTLCRIFDQTASVPYNGGSTNTAGALKVARQMLQATSSYKRILLLITDGRSNTGGSPISFAQQMRDEDGITIVTLGVTNSIRVSELQGISGEEEVLRIDSFDEFHDLAEFLISANVLDDDPDMYFSENCEADNSVFNHCSNNGTTSCVWEAGQCVESRRYSHLSSRIGHIPSCFMTTTCKSSVGEIRDRKVVACRCPDLSYIPVYPFRSTWRKHGVGRWP